MAVRTSQVMAALGTHTSLARAPRVARYCGDTRTLGPLLLGFGNCGLNVGFC